ncbi:MAG TPA: BlaI/MecI/CopY family transcriptional regulator [Spongiibacteraceae bacterium]|nr:BlaI/MecI/CopY family transcriptional regulator [Spongiibacteraceae bacterium]
MALDLSKPEFSVLSVLWKQQPLSVREVHDRLSGGWAYTTTKTVMDRMAEKKLLERDTVNGSIVYRAKVERTEGLVQWVRFIAEKIFEIDADEVVSLFAKRNTYSAKEIAALRKLILQAEAADHKSAKNSSR